MSESWMQLIIVGRATADAQLSYTQQGRAVCSFTLAQNRSWKDKNTGEWQNEPTFFRVSLWGAQAEGLHQYIKKGGEYTVICDRIKGRTYQTADGETRVSLDVTAQALKFGNKKQGGSDDYEYTDDDDPYAHYAGGNGGGEAADDIPF